MNLSCDPRVTPPLRTSNQATERSVRARTPARRPRSAESSGPACSDRESCRQTLTMPSQYGRSRGWFGHPSPHTVLRTTLTSQQARRSQTPRAWTRSFDATALIFRGRHVKETKCLIVGAGLTADACRGIRELDSAGAIAGSICLGSGPQVRPARVALSAESGRAGSWRSSRCKWGPAAHVIGRSPHSPIAHAKTASKHANERSRR
jgi:hypothetical protein